jgi:hypothetical protein
LEKGELVGWRPKTFDGLQSTLQSVPSQSIVPMQYLVHIILDGFMISVLGKLARLRKASIFFVVYLQLSLRYFAWNNLNGISRNLISKYFSKIWRKNSSLITNCQELHVLYMKTYVHLCNKSVNSSYNEKC